MRRPRVPKALPITIVVLLVLGIAASRLIPTLVSSEALSRNVLISAIPFILIFVAILLTYIMLIVMVATAINDQVDARVYNWIMRIVIAAIILGIVGMFQALKIQFYTYGFVALFIATLTYILWSHVRPARAVEDRGAAEIEA